MEGDISAEGNISRMLRTDLASPQAVAFSGWAAQAVIAERCPDLWTRELSIER